jgi:hypothetical protein
MSGTMTDREVLERIATLLAEIDTKLDALTAEMKGINSNTAQTTYMTGWPYAKPTTFAEPRHPNKR